MKTKGYLWGLWVSLCFVACSEKGANVLELSTTELQLDANGTRQRVMVLTDSDFWQVTGASEWISVERDSCFLWIEAGCNPSREKREGMVFVTAEGKYVRLHVVQAKSVRGIGDPYPDSISPVGIIYKVTDGGVHGKVMSLDEFRGKWGEDGKRWEGMSDDNGKKNTQEIIKTMRDKDNFTRDYALFAWLNEKNGGQLEGEWYIPAFHELNELYHIVAGCEYKQLFYVPQKEDGVLRVVHDIDVCDRFDMWLEIYGGVPLKYGQKAWYWTSTVSIMGEESIACLFINNDSYSPLVQRNEERYARAILEY